MRIGVDIGNVIIGGGGDDTQFFGDDYLNTPEVEGAWESLTALSSNHELHIVSKCGLAVEKKSLEWLDLEGFRYCFPDHRVYFVRKRHLKAPMAQALELDIFIDDRKDIIDSMIDIVAYPILFTNWYNTNQQLREIFDWTFEG